MLLSLILTNLGFQSDTSKKSYHRWWISNCQPASDCWTVSKPRLHNCLLDLFSINFFRNSILFVVDYFWQQPLKNSQSYHKLTLQREHVLRIIVWYPVDFNHGNYPHVIFIAYGYFVAVKTVASWIYLLY